MKLLSQIGKRTIFVLLTTGILLAGVLIGVFMNTPTTARAQQSQLTSDEARAAAEAVSPGAAATHVVLEHEGGKDVYEVQLDNGIEVEIDAATGEILATEQSDDGDDANDGPDTLSDADDD